MLAGNHRRHRAQTALSTRARQPHAEPADGGQISSSASRLCGARSEESEERANFHMHAGIPEAPLVASLARSRKGLREASGPAKWPAYSSSWRVGGRLLDSALNGSKRSYISRLCPSSIIHLRANSAASEESGRNRVLLQ